MRYHPQQGTSNHDHLFISGIVFLLDQSGVMTAVISDLRKHCAILTLTGALGDSLCPQSETIAVP